MFNQTDKSNKTPKGAGVHKNDTNTFSLWDVPLALVLLTRLPLPKLPDRVFARQSAAVWAFPIAGVAVGALACLVGWAATGVGLPVYVSAALIVATLIVATGAMHEDGLTDTADGFWGGYTRERRLEIMKDSHIGTYGVLALLLSQLVRVMAIAALLGSGGILTVLVACTVSRALMPALMAGLPNARQSGLSHSVGRPRAPSVLAGMGLALLIGLLILGSTVILPVLFAGFTAVIVAVIARSKIGGQTGDVLGATQQLSEIAFLMAVISTL